MSTIETYLEQLNKEQREAVLENKRPLLVLAGAGSGKTRVITTKIAYALEVLKLQPHEILAVTFTNKAAKEMRDRVEQMVEEVDVSQMHIRTFHSFGAWLLRRYGSSIGLSSSFTIYDDEDSLSLLASCFPDKRKSDLSPIAKAISLAKDMGFTPESSNLDTFRNDEHFRLQFATYEKRLQKVGNVDFADLISRSIELLATNSKVKRALQSRFKMVLVDEYQDSNSAQFTLLKELVGDSTFICVVGDDDQSIYRFRGAEVSNILNFPDHYPNTKIVKLEQNYRSTQPILSLATSVISNNHSRHKKTLWTAKTEGSKGRLIYISDSRAEAHRVAVELKQRGNYNQSAVIYRTNAQSREFETLFTQLHIPFKVIGALRFYEREEVKDALALLSLLMNPLDEVNFKRMINKPTRGIGNISVEKIVEFAEQNNLNLLEAAKRCPLSSKATEAAAKFASLFDEALRLVEQSNGEALHYLLEESTLLNYYKEGDLEHGTNRVDNLGTLVSTVEEYPPKREGLALFLESLTLDPTTIGANDPSKEEGVSLITMHNTKGLEFETVFITGLEDQIFPSRANQEEKEVEEERRLFYVAITRAKENLFLLSAQRRMVWGSTQIQTPCRFLRELDSDYLEVEGGYYQNREYVRPFSKPKIRNANITLTPVKSFAPTKEKRQKSTFTLGDRVYHESYGEGEVQKVTLLRGKEIIEVGFSTGHRATFFGENHVLEKLGGG